MANLVRVALFAVLCLVLLQNQVSSKPAESKEKTEEKEEINDEKPQGDQPVPQTGAIQQAAVQGAAPPPVKPADPAAPQPQTQHEASTQLPDAGQTVKEAQDGKKETTTATTTAAAKTSTEKNGNGGSSVIVANLAMLVLGACLLIRL